MSRLPARTAHALAALTLSLACGAAFAQAPEGAASAPSAADEPAVESLLDPSALKILASAPRVVVAGFRVAFVTRNAASAHSRSAFSNLGHSAGGGMRTVTQAAVARVDVALQNVDDARMQAIVERAYADFMAALQATGRPVVPLTEMQASAGWQQLEFTPTDKPYVTSPTGTQKHYRFAAPQALPLWFGHFDAPLGDRAPFSLGNWRALNQLSVDTGAVVIVPQLVVDFADLSSSGNSMWRRQAEVGAKSGMSIEAANSKLLIFHAKIAMAGDLGSAPLKEGLALPGEFGEFVDITDEATKTGTQVANVLTTALTMFTGHQGTVQSRQTQALQARPEAYEALAVSGAQQVGALYARAVGQYR
ncbi:MAG: hypothetical protein KA387_01655 [Rubrivivax sp.]|nr:hypothetical protein [Rubrivivax sp.]